MKLKELKDKFIKEIPYYCRGIKQESAESVILEFAEDNEGLFDQDISGMTLKQRNDFASNVASAITTYVLGYNQTKDTAIKVFKGFMVFIGDVTEIAVGLAFPDVDISSTFDRMMYEIRRMQEEGVDAQKLSEELYVSTRTIQRDLNRLRGYTDDPISINGRKIILEEKNDTRNGHITKVTQHPLFLMENLTQVIVILHGLYIVTEQKEYSAYAYFTAKEIASQLTKYAEKRVLKFLEEIVKAPFREINWFYGLFGEKGTYTFVSEAECSKYGGSCLAEMMKNEVPLTVVCADGHIYNEVRIRPSRSNGCLDLVYDNHELAATVENKDIIKCLLDGTKEIIL